MAQENHLGLQQTLHILKSSGILENCSVDVFPKSFFYFKMNEMVHKCSSLVEAHFPHQHQLIIDSVLLEGIS